MRFLCVQCDEAMAFVESKGPDEGSVTAIFRCPTCSRDIAMLTNPHETQIVQSLHVQLGGRSAPPKPLEAIRGSLAHSREMEEQPTDQVSWTPEALTRLERVPDFVRPMVKKGIEDTARQRGVQEITVQVMDAVRDQMGM